MLAITLGFASSKNNADPVLLYLGRDGAAAREALLNPPEGIGFSQLFLNPPATRRRAHSVDEVSAPEPVEEFTAPEAPVEESPVEAEAPAEVSADAPAEKTAGLSGVLKGKK
jgi:hypothetical protein